MTQPGPWDWAQAHLLFPNMGVGMSPRRYIRPVTPLPLGYAPGPAVPPPMAAAPVDITQGSVVDAAAQWGGLLNTFNPVSDISDSVAGSERFSQGILAGDPWEAASGFIDTAGGLLGIAVPGTFSQYKEGSDAVRRAVDDIVTPRPSGAAARDGIDSVDTAPRGLLGDAATGDRGGLLGYTGAPSTGAEYAAGSGASAAPAAGEAALAGPLSSDPGRLVAGERSAADGTGVAGGGTSPGILSDPYVSWSRLPPGGQRSLGSGPWVTQGRPVADDFSAAERRVAPPGTMTDPEGRPIVAPIVVGQRQSFGRGHASLHAKVVGSAPFPAPRDVEARRRASASFSSIFAPNPAEADSRGSTPGRDPSPLGVRPAVA